MGQNSNLINKIDAFIKKHYRFLILRGTLFSFSIGAAALVLVSYLEWWIRFESFSRGILAVLFLIAVLYPIINWVLIPASKLFKIGKQISVYEASVVIGNHFPEIKDKLLNTLQLQQIKQEATPDLILAAIHQKEKELSPFPFHHAIQYKEINRYLKFALPPVIILVTILFIWPSTITLPANRIIHFNKSSSEFAPFDLSVSFPSNITENQTVDIVVSITGDEIPDKLFLIKNGERFLMEKNSFHSHHISLNHISASFDFSISNGEYTSNPYQVTVLPQPRLNGIKAKLIFPEYLKLDSQTINNVADLVVPEGTVIHWDFNSSSTKNVTLKINQSLSMVSVVNNHSEYSVLATSSFPYCIIPYSNYGMKGDSLYYFVQVTPDLLPSIDLLDSVDTSNGINHIITGHVNDDYGFSKLRFLYRKNNGSWNEQLLPVSKSEINDIFYFNIDQSSVQGLPGDTVSFLFEVFDNDGIHGPKSTKSRTFQWVFKTEKEIDQQNQQLRDELIQQLDQALKSTKNIEREISELEKRLIEKKQLDWQDKKKLNDLLQKQNLIQEDIKQLQEKQKDLFKKENEQSNYNEKFAEKQQHIESLFKQLLNPEIKKQLEQIQKEMDQVDKSELQKELEKLDNKQDEFEKDLDRTLEQLQRLELEQKLDKTIQDINKINQKQEELTKKSESGNFGSKELLMEQEIINSEFQQIKEDIRTLEKLNESLSEPMTFPDTQEQQNKIENELENSKTNLEQNKKGNAVKNQKGASEKLKELENQLSSSQDKNNEEQNQENEEHLRQILEDLISVSYSQEALMNDFKKSSASNPNFDQLGRRQKKLNYDFKTIEDSLFALSKRASQISEFINKEVGSIKIHLSNAMLEIPERHIPEINQEQHYAMTNMNNLALMLDESLHQMQQEQQQNKESKGKPKDGNCKKPGGKGKPKPSAGQLKKMQDALSKQLESLKKQGKNQGKSGENGNPLLSKELAKAAAQQAALRKLVEDKASELNQDGSGAGNEMKQIAKEMEQIQKDIVNNAISETTLRRQQDILTRLLKAENAERTQDQDEERKSSAGHELDKQAPPGLEEYLKKKNRDLELMETMPVQLKNYYKQKSNEYLLNRFPK